MLRSDADADITDVPFPVFVKPLAEGTGKGCGEVSRVESQDALRLAARTLRLRFQQPAIAESFLPGREFTVGIVGNGKDARVLGVMEIHVDRDLEDSVYSLEAKENWQAKVRYTLAVDGEAQRAGEFALKAYDALDCRDAARLDFRSDAAGVPQFLEANVLPGLRPGYSDLPILADLAGVSFDRLLAEILEAATTRTGLQTCRRRSAGA